MKIYKIGERRIAPGQAFESDDGTKHPANWAECWGAEDFKRWGIVAEEAPDPEPPPPPKRKILKSLVIERLTDAQLEKALSLMTARQKERWRTPGYPDVNVEDPELLGILTAIGADPDAVLVAD